MTTELFLTALAVVTIIIAAAAAVVDWRTCRVPNSLVSLALAPVVVAVACAAAPLQRLLVVAIGAGLMTLPVLLIHVVSPAAMGFGDVKLSTTLGAALGLLAPALAVAALAAAAGLSLLVAATVRRVAVPFAPGLVAGAGAALALATFEGWKVVA